MASPIDALKAALRKFADGTMRKQIAIELANATVGLLAGEFNTKTDPYGKRWAPPKKPQTHPLLIKTGRMLGSIRARATDRGVTATVVGYAEYHQEGTRHMPARMLFPVAERGLGPSWEPKFVAAADGALRKAVGK